MPAPNDDPNPVLSTVAEIGPALVVMLLWGLHLGFPLHLLQHIRGTFFGHVIPIYYLFFVLPMMGAALLMLSLKRRWTKWELAWWILPLICVPGIFLSADRAWSIRQWSSWVVRGIIPGGILFSACRARTESMLSKWIYPVIIAASLVGLWEIYDDGRINLWDNPLLKVQLALPQSANDPFYRPHGPAYQLPLSNRPGGTQANRLAYTSTLVGFLPLGLWLLKYKKRFLWARLCATGVLFSILLLCQVRTVWLMTLASLIAMGAVGLLKDRRDTAAIIAGALVLFGVYLAWPRTHHLLWPRMNSFHLADASIRERLRALNTAQALKDHSLFGVGFGQFPATSGRFSPIGLGLDATPDNQYLRWAIENGVPGLGLLLTFIAWLIHAGWARIQQIRVAREADFHKAMLVGWASVAGTFLFFDGFYWGACDMTFWCLLGLFASCLTPAETSASQ